MKKILFFIGFCAIAFPVAAKNIPGWFIPLREAIFEQTLNADAVIPLYREAVRQAEASLSGPGRDAMLSRCEYLMGRAYQEDARQEEALACYERGIALAERSVAAGPTAEGYEMLSANYGQACMLKPTGWVMANGLKVEQYAKKALELDGRDAASRYFIASRWVFGPGILGNPQRGIRDMEAILDGQADLEKDDYFNVYSAIAYAYIRLKKHQDALPWLNRALGLYPTNKFALDLREQIQKEYF
jgi:tetratricopeptide (TPR) repeat protein